MGVNGPLFTMGIQLALTVLILVLGGEWLDRKLGTSPWLMIAGIMIGTIGGIVKFVMGAMEVGREEDKNKGKDSDS